MTDETINYEQPSKQSRYKKYKVFVNPTNLYYELPRHITIPVHADDKYFMVNKKYVNRIDLVAHKYYKMSKLWWVIAMANSLEDPMDLPHGTVLRIPAESTLFGLNGVVGSV